MVSWVESALLNKIATLEGIIRRVSILTDQIKKISIRRIRTKGIINIMINPIKTNSTKISIPTRNQTCIRITIRRTLITRMIHTTAKSNRTKTINLHPTTIRVDRTSTIPRMRASMIKAMPHTSQKAIKNQVATKIIAIARTTVSTTMSKEGSSTTAAKITITIRSRAISRTPDRINKRIRGEEE